GEIEDVEHNRGATNGYSDKEVWPSRDEEEAAVRRADEVVRRAETTLIYDDVALIWTK
ncbi:hypothetical protein PIB30_099548, partial [Stylosanthes scabra]|nr:hypothetical protein [Stylosanthes scabra]